MSLLRRGRDQLFPRAIASQHGDDELIADEFWGVLGALAAADSHPVPIPAA